MNNFRTGQSRKEVMLLPPCIDDYISKEDITRYIDEIVEEFDISKIEQVYSCAGRRAYDPRIIIKILMLGTMKGIRSARELEQASRYNLRFIYLARNEKPDYRTIARFRQKFGELLSEFLSQTVQIGIKEGYISLDTVVLDGTKIGAYAGRNSFKDPKKLQVVLDKLDNDISKCIKEDIQQDIEDEQKKKKLFEDSKIPENLLDNKKRRAKIKTAVEEYKQAQQKPKTVSTTDPEARFMKSKGINPAYNAQAALDVASDMVVGGYVTNEVNDCKELNKLVDNVKKTTSKTPNNVAADKGYGISKEELAKLEERKINGYIAVPKEKGTCYKQEQFEYNKKNDTYSCPAQQTLKLSRTTNTHKIYLAEDCLECPLRAQCLRSSKTKRRMLKVSFYNDAYQKIKKRVNSEQGRKILKLRSAFIERLFANIKHIRKFRKFTHIGLSKVNNVWIFELAVYNISRIIKLRQQKALIPIKI